MKKFFLKLKTTLLYKNLINHYHFVVIGIVLLGLIYYFKNWLVVIGLLLYLSYLFYKNPKIAFFTCFILGVFLLGLIIKDIHFKNRLLGPKKVQMTVVEAKRSENTYNLVIKDKHLKYQLNSDDCYEVGDVLNIQGTFTSITENHVPLLFNYQQYCQYAGIGGTIKESQITKIGHTFVWESIQNQLFHYFDQYFSTISSTYLKALVLGDKSGLDNQVLNKINNLGISHLFVVSGLHVALLIGMIELVLKKIIKGNKVTTWLTMILLIIYTIITNFLVSVIRVVLGFVFKQINQKYQLHLTSLDILSIVTIMLVLYNPYYLFSSSFILSFSLTYALIIGSELLQSKNYLKGLIKMSIYCQIVSIPLVYDFSNKINLFSVLFNLICVPFISYIFLPASLIIIFLPFLNKVYEMLIKLFEIIIDIMDKISLYITIPTTNIIFLMSFLIIIYMMFRMIENKKIKKSIIILLIVYMGIWLNYGTLNIYDQIIFFDLPNGEATLIHKAFNQYNLLIDTGDITSDQNNTILQYLNKRGIKTLDYVIITHSDSDHIGGLETIMKDIKVKNIITSYYEEKTIFNYYKKYNKQLNIYYLQRNDYFNYNGLQFYCLSPYTNLGDVNNNSLVFLLTIEGFKILFTGDIEALGEKHLEVDKTIECNILKIAHHGSKTSTTLEFLEKIKFEEAIIMNGYHNIFDFPSPIVTNRLKNHTYYITSIEKTIIYQKLFFKKMFLKI